MGPVMGATAFASVRLQARAFSPGPMAGKPLVVAFPLALSATLGLATSMISSVAFETGSETSAVVAQRTVPLHVFLTLSATIAATVIVIVPETIRKLRPLHLLVRRHSATRRAGTAALAAQMLYVLALLGLLLVPLITVSLSQMWHSGLLVAGTAVTAAFGIGVAGGAIALAVSAGLDDARGPSRIVAVLAMSALYLVALFGVRASVITVPRAGPSIPWLAAAALLVLGGCAAVVGLASAGAPFLQESRTITTPRLQWSGRGRLGVIRLETLHRSLLRQTEARLVATQCICVNVASATLLVLYQGTVVDDAAPFLLMLNCVIWSHLVLSYWARYARFPYYERYGVVDARPCLMSFLVGAQLAVVPVGVFLLAVYRRSGDADGVLIGIAVTFLSMTMAAAAGVSPALRARLAGSESLVMVYLFIGSFMAVRLGGVIVDQSGAGFLVLVAASCTAVVFGADARFRSRMRQRLGDHLRVDFDPTEQGSSLA